ncbi:MAG: putative E2-like ubiquitin conjugating protein [Promethearchaeota archaeon]|nr:MAG: putative E2-like ubiquitin conjugating protein [Candidatus Lokiarchaeota archaeon]
MSLRSRRVAQDFAALKKMRKQGTIVQLKPWDKKNKSIDHLKITIEGPKGTAYEGGLFRLEVRFPAQYPKVPPFLRLYTPIWHPNFWPKPHEYKGQRNICLALIDPSLIGQKGGWSPSKTIVTVINAIIAMLNTQGKYFNPTDVFNKKAALEAMNKRDYFEDKVKHLVDKYANKKW